MTHFTVVYVEWLNSMVSVGIKVKETEDSLVLASSFDEKEQEFRGRIYIPLKQIQKARTLCQIQRKS